MKKTTLAKTISGLAAVALLTGLSSPAMAAKPVSTLNKTLCAILNGTWKTGTVGGLCIIAPTAGYYSNQINILIKQGDTLEIASGLIFNYSTITNNGTLKLDPASNFINNAGSIANSGTILIIDTALQNNGGTMTNSGNITGNAGSSLFNYGGTITNTGTINVGYFAGNPIQ